MPQSHRVGFLMIHLLHELRGRERLTDDINIDGVRRVTDEAVADADLECMEASLSGCWRPGGGAIRVPVREELSI
jgi:hypothetical protein